jgi:hypothetical protein
VSEIRVCGTADHRLITLAPDFACRSIRATSLPKIEALIGDRGSGPAAAITRVVASACSPKGEWRRLSRTCRLSFLPVGTAYSFESECGGMSGSGMVKSVRVLVGQLS